MRISYRLFKWLFFRGSLLYLLLNLFFIYELRGENTPDDKYVLLQLALAFLFFLLFTFVLKKWDLSTGEYNRPAFLKYMLYEFFYLLFMSFFYAKIFTWNVSMATTIAFFGSLILFLINFILLSSDRNFDGAD